MQAAVRRGRGSARDALSALDQVAASGTSDSARPELSAVLAATGQGEVAGVLVSLSALLAGGWGPQQLATELVDDLRQVFLAALAPELCAVSGSLRAEFSALAESMGLARVVRSMEVLGRALMDMRDAPDAQVVLEIAMVRATRPDLDPGVDALTERVAALERGASAGRATPARLCRPNRTRPPRPPPTTPIAPAQNRSIPRLRRPNLRQRRPGVAPSAFAGRSRAVAGGSAAEPARRKPSRHPSRHRQWPRWKSRGAPATAPGVDR